MKSRGCRRPSWASRDMIRYSCSTTLRTRATSWVGRTGGSDSDTDADPSAGGELVRRRPVLPAHTVVEGFVVDHPRADLTLPALYQADAAHQVGQDGFAVGHDDLAGGGGLQQPGRDARQTGSALAAVESEQVDPTRRGEHAAQPGVVEEDRLLHERHDVAGVVDLGPGLLGPAQQLLAQLARQPLRLASGELERRVLGPVAVSQPAQVVPPQRAAVVLQPDQVQPALAKDDQIDLVPLALPVPELDVGPGPVRRGLGQQRADHGEALGLVRERRGGDLDPPGSIRHAAASSSVIALVTAVCLPARVPPRGVTAVCFTAWAKTTIRRHPLPRDLSLNP